MRPLGTQARLQLILATLSSILIFIATSSNADAEQTLSGSPRDAQRWNFFLREDKINQFWMQLSARRYPSHFAIENVSLIALKDDSVMQNMTVIVNDGLIVAVGPSADIPIPNEVQRLR